MVSIGLGRQPAARGRIGGRNREGCLQCAKKKKGRNENEAEQYCAVDRAHEIASTGMYECFFLKEWVVFFGQ